jgi:integrase
MAGTIAARGTKSWRLTYDVGRDATGRRVRRTETIRGSYKEAEKRLTEVLSQRDQGFDVEPNRLTVDQYLTRWLAEHDVTPQSKARYAQLIRLHVSPTLGMLRLTALKPLHIQTCVSDASRSISPSTARDVLTVLRMAIAQAVRWELLSRNPADAVERPRVEETAVMRVLLPDEIARLLAAAEGTEFAPLIALTLGTGIRRGEALALKWPAVDLDESTITIVENARFQPGAGVVYGTPKTRKSNRVIALSADNASMLREHRKAQVEQRLKWGPAWMNSADLVFVNQVGEGIPIGSFNHRFNRIVARAGLAPCRFHDLRHTHGTLLAGAGVNAKVVSDRLGHSDVKFTLNRYVTPTQDHQRAAAEAFSAILKAAR